MKIEWIGEDRELAVYGAMTINDIKDVDDNTAADLIAQGLAREYTIKKKDTKKVEEVD